MYHDYGILKAWTDLVITFNKLEMCGTNAADWGFEDAECAYDRVMEIYYDTKKS